MFIDCSGALYTYLEELDESEDEVVPSGIKLTLKFNAGEMGEGKVNVILKQTENDDGETELELAVRFEANMEMNQLEIKAKGDLYYKDDVLYMDTKVEGLDDAFGAEAENTAIKPNTIIKIMNICFFIWHNKIKRIYYKYILIVKRREIWKTN